MVCSLAPSLPAARDESARRDGNAANFAPASAAFDEKRTGFLLIVHPKGGTLMA